MNQKQAMENKAELALMGKFIPVENEEEVRFITNYILRVLGKYEFLRDFDIYHNCIRPEYTGQVVRYLGVNTLCGMRCITYCLEDPEGPKPFEEDYGSGYPCSFCYVFNMDAYENCSEVGDVFFIKRSDGYYHRAT